MPPLDRTKQNAYQAKWYQANKAKRVAEVSVRRRLTRELIDDMKTPCACGESDKRCLDFHHVDPATKLFRLGEAHTLGYSREKVIAEMDKCVVMCSNCHRKHHR